MARITTPASQAFEIGPYLQQLTPTGAEIVWQTYEPATTALRFGPAGGPLAVVERDPELRRRHAVPVRGLQPGADYSYQWESDGKLGKVSTFRTPVAGPDVFSFGVIGDFGIGTPAARANLRRLSADPAVDLAITTGDNAQIYGTEDEYRRFVLGPLRDLIATKPFWPSVGNHDYYNLQNYLRFFALPNGGLYYSFTYGGVLFLALDSNRFDAQAAALAAGRAARVDRPLQGRLLPPPAVVERARLSRAYAAPAAHALRPDPGARRRRPGAQRPRAELRALQAAALGPPQPARGIVYVVTGGGGASLNGFVTKRRPKWSARRGVFFHRLRVRVEKRVFRGKAIDAAGNTRDRFRVPCRPG